MCELYELAFSFFAFSLGTLVFVGAAALAYHTLIKKD